MQTHSSDIQYIIQVNSYLNDLLSLSPHVYLKSRCCCSGRFTVSTAPSLRGLDNIYQTGSLVKISCLEQISFPSG